MKLKISEDILSLVPYKPGQSEADVKKQYNRDFFVKLASNESPLEPSKMVKEALSESIKNLSLYPDPGCQRVREVASKYYDVPTEKILVGNGSNELVDLLIRVMCEPEQKVMTSVGAFIAYKICTKASRAQIIEVPLKEGYSIDLEAMSDELEKMSELPQIVFIPNPNNPTGSYIPENEMMEFLDKWGGNEEMLIVIDEAYNEFVDADDFPDPKKLMSYENVLLMKTMSKVFGLAGLRIGFLLGSTEVLSLVHRIRNPFNVNAMAQVAACAALEDKEALDEVTTMIKNERYSFQRFLKEMNLDFVPSQANFVFFDTKRDFAKVHDALLREGLIIRPLAPYGFKTQMRITIGSSEQMSFAREVFKKVFK